MSFNFQEIMEQVQKKQLKEFQDKIQNYNQIRRVHYLAIFLGRFLGNDMFPPEEQVKTFEDTYFNFNAHRMIDMVSLNSEEIEFFHFMVDLKDNENFVNRCMDQYKKIPNLKNCQLGKNIWEFLESSKHLTITA
eukprot:c13812_g1_i1.p1 GENE.c13812_g1_i1~~c13812_g1_i1.p1  ORF type:complete len:134 (+),score=33.60 c13812_g1_i1:172-573(+)